MELHHAILGYLLIASGMLVCLGLVGCVLPGVHRAPILLGNGWAVHRGGRVRQAGSTCSRPVFRCRDAVASCECGEVWRRPYYVIPAPPPLLTSL